MSEPRYCKRQRPATVDVTGRVEELRNRPGETPFFWIRIPIRFIRGVHGQILIVIDIERLPEHFKLSPLEMEDLKESFPYVSTNPKIHTMRQRIDYPELAESYLRLIRTGVCKTKADVARHVGVSRVWVTRVLNNLSKRERIRD